MPSPQDQEQTIRLSTLLAPSFYDVHNEILDGENTFFKLSGGRGSTKSSFISLEIILGIMKDAQYDNHTNAIVFRRFGNNLRDSVFEQLIWAIDALGASDYWRATISPLKLTYLPTGQTILFRGADNPKKSKSIKVSQGYIKYLWFEELDEFEGPEKIRVITQSVIRGGEKFTVFYSFNPPKSQASWVNDPLIWEKPGTLSHHSTYLDVPPDWLGEQFILEAEYLKKTKPEAYEHEYMGEVTGTGGEVFRNVTARPISEEEIAQFETKRYGLDEGYAIDPLAFVSVAYERKYKKLYIYDELYAVGMSNKKAFDAIINKNPRNDTIYCDSAAARFINELRQYGLRISAVKKGADSVEYGIKFLADLEEIVIDPNRCPNAVREFIGYELSRDTNGNFKADFPDRNNHTIDAVRYALSSECMYHREEKEKKPPAKFNFPSERKNQSSSGGIIVTESFFKDGWDI